jgi:hypothetical protein
MMDVLKVNNCINITIMGVCDTVYLGLIFSQSYTNYTNI